MTVPPIGPAPEAPQPAPDAIDLFARIEGLIGEEDALLRIPARERSERQRDRLHDIGEELDRIFHSLRRRAERLASPRASEAGR